MYFQCIFGCFLRERVAYAGARLPKVASPRFRITTSPQPATFLLDQDTSVEEAGYLAIPSYCCIPTLFRRNILGYFE
jgi:hypothetical protein